MGTPGPAPVPWEVTTLHPHLLHLPAETSDTHHNDPGTSVGQRVGRPGGIGDGFTGDVAPQTEPSAERGPACHTHRWRESGAGRDA